MTNLLFVAAIVAAVTALALRRRAKVRRRRAATSGPGSSAASAIPIRDFGEMDALLAQRRCPSCGVRLDLAGEGSRAHEGRTLRVARLACDDCDESLEVFFDTSELLQ
jgi:hypothetical protein